VEEEQKEEWSAECGGGVGEEKLPQEKWREERRRAVFKATS
jgi:hypothetical protein